MSKVTRIHPTKKPVRQNPPRPRRHYFAEWLEERSLEPMEFLNILNDAAGMDQDIIDKSQVYRWISGNQPQDRFKKRIADALGLHDPETGLPDWNLVLSHPAQVWIARKVSTRPPEDIRRMRELIDLAFPEKTGTEG